MGESMEKLVNAIKHYQDSLERHTKTGNVEKLLHAIQKLGKLPIKVCHLEDTGVGRTVNGLKKFEGSVGENARSLVDKWKNMVKGEEDEEERARLEKEQEMQEEEEIDTSYEDPESLQIVEPEENKAEENVKLNSSSHRQSSSSNKQSHSSSKHSSRHKKSKRHHSSSDSDSSDTNKKSKRHRSSKNYTKDSESDSESSDSSRDRSSKSKHKSRKSSSESGDESSSDSQGSSSSDRDRRKHKSNSSKEFEKKDKKYKKSSSDSDRDKHRSKDRHHSSKDKSRDHSKSKSSQDSRSKKDSSSKSRSESKHEKDKNSSSRSESKKKESSKSHRENGKTSEEKKRHRESPTDKEAKRQKNDHKDSSSSKSGDKGKKKSEDSSRREKDKKDSSKSSKDKPKASSKIDHMDYIDSGSGTSFEAALGMLGASVTSKPKKKIVETSQSSKSSSSNEKSSRSSNSKESSSKSSSSKESSSKSSTSKDSSSKSVNSNGLSSKSSSSKESSSSKSHHKTSEVTNSKNLEVEEVDLFKNPTNLEPLPQDIDISSLLPSITPHYRPLGVSLDGFRRNLTDDEALSRVITAKHQRTKVYSGNKASYTKVPSLFDICCRILQDNIDALEYTGGVPYSILKPILEKANPDQLYQLEFHNPYLIEDTDELWQLHCQKEFRNKKKEEMESGREMYLRCLDEREAKLKALTANIKQSQDKSVPVRQTKLAYVDSVVKPPRNIARKQARNGTMFDSQRPAQTTQERLSQIAKAGEAGKVVVPKPGRPVSERSSSSNLKPKKAPLMAKTLSLLKNRFGRR